jgi:hypothetical protein
MDIVSPDSRSVLICRSDSCMAYPLEGGEPKALLGISTGELPVQWTIDGRSLFVCSAVRIPWKVYLLDVATGRKRLWKDINPVDRAGLLGMGSIRITPDGRAYAYSVIRMLSDLYVVDGLI